jgi:hypothetical protein
LGPVFRAYDPEGERLVAVKLFRLDLPIALFLVWRVRAIDRQACERLFVVFDKYKVSGHLLLHGFRMQFGSIQQVATSWSPALPLADLI